MIFLTIFVLLSFVFNLQLIQSATVGNKTIDEVSSNLSTSPNDCINNLKLEHLNHALKKIDESVQSLKEKAHNWAIFRHHIDAWNEQIKSLEHKIDLVKRTQDEQKIYESKLISLEFTLNHILSKVVYLSDKCNTQQVDGIAPTASTRSSSSFNIHSNSNNYGNDRDNIIQQQEQLQRDTNELLYKNIVLLGDLKQSISVNKPLREEFLTRLSNILRHVQNIERNNCLTERQHITLTNNNNKMTKLITPIGGNCNSNQNVERALKSLENKVSILHTRASIPKDLKQLPTLANKNSKQLEYLMNWIKTINARLLQWSDESDHGWSQCQTMSGELSTFTESSDLLLKRIELLMNNVNEKLSKQLISKSNNEHDVKERFAEEDLDDKYNGYQVENGTDIDQYNDDKNEGDGQDVHIKNIEHDIRSTKSVDTEEQTPTNDDRFDNVDFLQPEKNACHELNGPSSLDGVYIFSTPLINEDGRNFNERYCAFVTEGAAWTVIQNRGPYSKHQNFNRTWLEYKNGFGELTNEFWFGNEFIHQIVDSDDYELRIELTDFDNEHVWAEYSFFRLDSEEYNYNLLIGGYNGTAPDAMHYHNEMDFSTYDRPNDRSVDPCCACGIGYGSGWWFNSCSGANLNGIYRETPKGHNYVGIIWEQWRGDYSLLKARMLIRPKILSKRAQNRDKHHEHNEDP